MEPIQDLQDYVSENTLRLARDAAPALRQEFAAVVDAGFFLVGVRREADAGRLMDLAAKAPEGCFGVFDPFAQDCDYIDVGAWIGDQGLALHFMAMAEHLRLGRIVTPERINAAMRPDLEILPPGNGRPAYVNFIPCRTCV